MANKKVVISVSGGVANVDESPEGIDVVIKDYDTDGCDRGNLKEDEHGWYAEVTFSGG